MKEILIELIEKNLFDMLPHSITVIDSERNIILGNKAFEEKFGNWDNKKLNEIADKFDTHDINEIIEKTFSEAKPKLAHKSLYDNNGKLSHVVIDLIPLEDKNGKVSHIVCVTNDITEANQWQEEFKLLFERVPSFVSIVDKELNVIKANKRYNESFGEGPGSFAYDSQRKRKTDALSAPASKAFKEKTEQVATQVAFSANGVKNHYIISAFPFQFDQNGNVELVMEIGTDITEINALQEQLSQAHDFYADLIESSADAIIATEKKGKIQIFNQAARDLFEWTLDRKPGIPKLKGFMPKEFYAQADENGIIAKNNELEIITANGRKVPVRFNALELRNKHNVVGKVAFIQDLTEVKRLEEEKRLAEKTAINHTFSVLESNIKKLLNDLRSNIDNYDYLYKNGDSNEKDIGWHRLKQKLTNTYGIVESFVVVAKGYKPKYTPISIKEFIEDMIHEYQDVALDYNVDVVSIIGLNKGEELLFDRFSLDSLIRVLMTNAIDNVIGNKDIKGKVIFTAKIIEDNLLIKLEDNGFNNQENELGNYLESKNEGELKLGMLTLELIVKAIDAEFEINTDKEFFNEFILKIPIK